jgi:hypothetical protein
MFTKKDLLQQRTLIDQLRTQNSLSPQNAAKLGQSIASSWERSASAAIPKERFAAPLVEKKTASQNALDMALSQCADDLRHNAEQSSSESSPDQVHSVFEGTFLYQNHCKSSAH